MNIVETAYDMPTGMLLHEAGRQFAMAELVRDDWQRALYERGGWFLLLVWAERTCGVAGTAPAQPKRYRWDQETDDTFGFMVGPVPDGEWVKWADVAHVFGVTVDRHQTFCTKTPTGEKTAP